MLSPASVPENLLLKRTLEAELENAPPARATLLFGPRRIGKTTVLKQIVGNEGCRWYNGDMSSVIEELSFRSQGDVINALTQAPHVVIDEAHKVRDIGTIVKILVDANETLDKPCRIWLTSSSTFYLSTIRESALGRVTSFHMWPFSLCELAQKLSWGTVMTYLERFLVYGTMPAVCMEPERAQQYLQEYCEAYLLKDFYEQEIVRYPKAVRPLLEKLAYYVGSEISYDKLAQELGISRNTVEGYIERLQACSLIRVCPSYSCNLANEMKKGRKIYFFDNGVRNALIGKLEPFAGRPDAGALWENFFFAERQKLHDTLQDGKRTYFWRTTGNAPRKIDFIEEAAGKLTAFECKLSAQVKTTPHARQFLKSYPQATLTVVHPGDCADVFKDAYTKAPDPEAAAFAKLMRG